MKFDESDKNFDEAQLTPQQRMTLEASRRAQDPNYRPDQATAEAFGLNQIIAKYKIEILFGTNRTVAGPNISCLSVWESGKRFHGGGDEMVYWCKDVRDGEDAGCWGPIIGDFIHGGIAHCPTCGMMINANLLTGQRYMKVTTKRLAEHVADIWRILDHSADIYCKYAEDDIRYLATEKKLGPDEAERLRGLLIYPLKNIIKDTSAGATVEGRFEALFKA